MTPPLRHPENANFIRFHAYVFCDAFGNSGPGNRICSVWTFTQTIGEAFEFCDQAHRILKFASLTSRPAEEFAADECIAQQDSIVSATQLLKGCRASY